MIKQHLARETLKKLVVRIGAVVIGTSAFGYFHMISIIEEKTKETAWHYIAERGEREKILFNQAVDNHQVLAEEFLNRYQELLKNPQTPALFQKKLKTLADKTIRNRDLNFNGKVDVGIFIGPGEMVDPEFQARVLAAEAVTLKIGPAYHRTFQDTYFTFPENAIVLYWPEFPRWTLDAKANYNVLKEEYHAISAPENDPGRKTVWSGLFYDDVSRSWMVTASTPIYIGHKYVASVHHDILVNEVLERTVDGRLPGSNGYMIFRGDGRLILHPDYVEEIKRSEGRFDLKTRGSEKLKAQFQELLKIKGNSDVIESKAADEYLAVSKIAGPDWYLVSSYPMSTIKAPAARTATYVLIAGLFTLTLEVIILYSILNREVADPLMKLAQLCRKMARGNFEDERIEVVKQDELGHLANSFNEMLNVIHDRDEKLKARAVRLEEEVAEQKEIALHAMKMSALADMAGGIAQELNTPLISIQMVTAELTFEAKNSIPDLDVLAAHLLSIETNSDRMAKIVKALKAFSRHGQDDSVQNSSMRLMVEDTLELCSDHLKSSMVELRLVWPQEDMRVDCRSVQISQVILSLLSNSLDAVRNLEERWIEIRLSDRQDWVELRITDSGAGIAEDTRDKIFQPFYSTKDVGNGSGMGLSVSLGVVLNHNGMLYYDEHQKNTSFVIRLPKSQIRTLAA